MDTPLRLAGRGFGTLCACLTRYRPRVSPNYFPSGLAEEAVEDSVAAGRRRRLRRRLTVYLKKQRRQQSAKQEEEEEEEKRWRRILAASAAAAAASTAAASLASSTSAVSVRKEGDLAHALARKATPIIDTEHKRGIFPFYAR